MSNDKMREAIEDLKNLMRHYRPGAPMHQRLNKARLAMEAALTQQPESEPVGVYGFERQSFGDTREFQGYLCNGVPEPDNGALLYLGPQPSVAAVLELAWYHKLPGEDGDEDDYEIFNFKSDECDDCVEVAIIRMDHSAAPFIEPQAAQVPEWMMKVAEIACAYSRSIDAIEEDGGLDTDDPIEQIHYLCHYADLAFPSIPKPAAAQVPEGCDRDVLMRKIEALRDLHFDADDEFNRGARYAIKQIVRMAMAGEFDHSTPSIAEKENNDE